MRSISVNIIAFSYSSTYERRKVSERDIVNYEYFGYDAWGRRYKYGIGNVQIYFDTNTTLRDGANLLALFTRGYTGHEHLDMFGLINMNGRLYDPAIGRMLSPDLYVQAPTYTQSFNRYSYCLNNPLKYIDPSGEVWFVPVIIGAVIGAYAGASIQSGTAAFLDWKPDAWKGAIAGGIIGATLGYGFSATIGGATTASMTTSAGTLTKSAGLVSSMLNSGTINIAMNAMAGGGWDGAWKAGVAGLASGAWTATGGFGMVKAWGAENAFAQLGGKLGYQMIGTAGSSIGNNWARGEDPFSKVTLGVGPVNLTLGKGQKLLQWQNNLGNIATNALGLGNLAFGGKARFDWKNLAPVYTDGLMEKMGGAWGPYSVMGPEEWTNQSLQHEMHHIWQSRSLGDTFLLHYGLQGISGALLGKNIWQAIFELNYFETQAYGHYWFNP
ncbi:hypothetical protein FACS1894201_02480 [Bacteroidia bacterium]|nr:hypothetical protein FACS1894201_02480 [Bacteroidia bacterium]